MTPCLENMMTDTPRLIEHAFPLEWALLDSVHGHNVRLVRAQDPFASLLAKAKGSVLIGPAQIAPLCRW